jgi:CheY-like chemotaxis protein
MFKVLIAEDDAITADIAESILVNNGYDVCGIAVAVDEAVDLIRRHKPHLAIFDMHLANGELGTEIVTRLGHLDGLGVLYATGDNAHARLSTAQGCACLAKPYSPRDLVRSLEIVAEIMAHGRATPPFPPGFSVLPPARIASLRLAAAW